MVPCGADARKEVSNKILQVRIILYISFSPPRLTYNMSFASLGAQARLWTTSSSLGFWEQDPTLLPAKNSKSSRMNPNPNLV